MLGISLVKIAAASITIAVFIILAATHIWRIFKTKSWFCTPFIIGGISEIIGYGARIYGHYYPASLPTYIVQFLFILLAPILFAASVYMFLGRIIRATGYDSYSIVRPTKLTRIFVGGDILCFLIQLVGGGILAASDSKSSSDIGNGIILAGLGLQIVIFGFFMVIAVIWHMRIRCGAPVKGTFNWERYIWMLYVVSVFISVRNVFRVIEYAMGENGYLLANEWPIYIFDAILMAAVLIICSSWYVGDIITACEEDSSLGMIPINVGFGRFSNVSGN